MLLHLFLASPAISFQPQCYRSNTSGAMKSTTFSLASNDMGDLYQQQLLILYITGHVDFKLAWSIRVIDIVCQLTEQFQSTPIITSHA